MAFKLLLMKKMNNHDTDTVFVHRPTTVMSNACSRRQNDKNHGRPALEGAKNRVRGKKTPTRT
jgi:hypothetical protein